MAEPLNICVVDDDRDVAEGLAEILELAGHQVQTAFTGQDALRILDTTDCDIAFINATLPELNTLESFMAIRKAKPGLKTVMMTGYTVEQLLKQSVPDGSVAVLQKPVTMDEVVRAVEDAKPRGIVLVAEDNPEIGVKIGDTLRLQDHRVGVARTAEDALDMVSADDCDVLVLNLREPVVGALEVYLDLVKQDRALPTIVISKPPDKDSGQVDLLRSPALTGVLVKPFDPALLLASLEGVHTPASQPPAEAPVEKIPQPTVNVGRILVIDDDRDLAEGLGDVLGDLGHTVEVAFTGSEALEIARRFDAQVALVDIKLGRTSGLELIGSLKELRPGIINVVITANAGKESVIASLRSGAFDFLNKPMHPQDLFFIIDRCFEQIRAQEAKAGGAGEAAPEFVANVSHELRDPLNAVIGFSEILGDEMLGPLGSEQYVHYARGINEAGHHLTTVIDDMIEHQPPTPETPVAERPQDAPLDSGDAHAASGVGQTNEQVPAKPAPSETRGDEVESDEPSADQYWDAEPGLGAPESVEQHGDTPQRETPLANQPEASLAITEQAVASPDGGEEAQPEASRPEPAETGDDVPASSQIDSIDTDPVASLFFGTIWDRGRSTPSDASRPQTGEAGVAPGFGSDPRSTEAESDLPERGQPHPSGAEPPQFDPTDLSPSGPAWNESPWETPDAAADQPVESGMPGIGWDEPPLDDLTAGPPDPGQPRPDHSPAVMADEEHQEQENEEESPELGGATNEDQEDKGEEENIVTLSPFRKVI